MHGFLEPRAERAEGVGDAVEYENTADLAYVSAQLGHVTASRYTSREADQSRMAAPDAHCRNQQILDERKSSRVHRIMTSDAGSRRYNKLDS